MLSRRLISLDKVRTSILTTTFLFALFNCSDEVSKGGIDSNNNQDDLQLSGTWYGVVKGIPIHFNGDPNITLQLSQSDTVITGTISTSDSAFLNVVIQEGLLKDSLFSFSAIQTTIYPGAKVKFMAKVGSKFFDGEWNHNRVHSGKWSAQK